MNRNTLSAETKRNLLRATIIIFDFVKANAVACILWLLMDRSIGVETGNKIWYLLAGVNVAMAISQLLFATNLHRHNRGFDTELLQTTFLCLTYSILCYIFVKIFGKWTDVSTPTVAFNLWLYGVTTVVIYASRIVEVLIIRDMRSKGYNKRYVLFAGDADCIEKIFQKLDSGKTSGLVLKGYYSDQEVSNNLELKHLGTMEDLVCEVKAGKTRISDDLYYSAHKPEQWNTLLDYSIANVIRFCYVPDFDLDMGAYLSPQVERGLVVYSNISGPLMRLGNRVIKRALDIVVSVIALVIILPFFPIIGLIIKLSSPGPIFFRQVRTGLNGKDFNMLKFRSMHVNKDADRLQATKNDSRTFAFGKFMRKTSIDELPQFINVLLGDMSIVGPRPHMKAHTDEYSHRIYQYMIRHTVRPGVTGWAQVNGFRGETRELWQMEERVKRDIWYIHNWSISLDIKIILRTILLIFINDKAAY